MVSSEAASYLSLVLAPALERIIKNASWRKHSKLAHQCKFVLELVTSSQNRFSPYSPPSDSEPDASLPVSLNDGGPNEYSLSESESILSPLMNAAASSDLKIADPPVDCIQKLISRGYLRGEAHPSGGTEAKSKTAC